MAPVIGLVGFRLFQQGFPAVGNCVEIGLPAVLLLIGLSQWGPPTFLAGHCFAMMSVVLVSMVESTGAYEAASRLAIATPPPSYVLSWVISWQDIYVILLGIGILFDGLFGTGTGTVFVENVGLLGLTRIGSRRVVQISAGFMIFFSILVALTLSRPNVDHPSRHQNRCSVATAPTLWHRIYSVHIFTYQNVGEMEKQEDI